jgi:ATP-dependent DNA ligase
MDLDLPLKPPLPPMEAKAADALPEGEGWQYEPKWDGFRCLVFKSGDRVELQSKGLKPLGRYFPEMVEAVQAMAGDRFVLDGELVIPVGGILSFEALQMRLHPAESRILRLALETPAQLILFDCLVAEGRNLSGEPLSVRREALEALHRRGRRDHVLLSPMTLNRDVAVGWLDKAGGALDGVVAKSRGARYAPGERAMLKIKQLRTADCVVGGFRYGTGSRTVGSLLLGLFNEDGRLDHAGFTSSFGNEDKAALTKRLETLRGPPGFTGDAPGGPSRWSTDRSAEWEPLRHELVVEVSYDHVTGRRFRHGTKFLRWRPDKLPEQCGFDQLLHEAPPAELAAELETVS